MHAIVALTALGLVLGFLLGMAAKRFAVASDPLVDELETLLPGTNCGQCGFAGCPAAAAALAAGAAPINLCPPGGRTLINELAGKLGVDPSSVDSADEAPKLARIIEEICIGCIKCFRECPTDAVVGAPKQIHGILWEACTGCGKCVDVCPTEAVQMVEPEATLRDWRWPEPALELSAA